MNTPFFHNLGWKHPIFLDIPGVRSPKSMGGFEGNRTYCQHVCMCWTWTCHVVVTFFVKRLNIFIYGYIYIFEYAVLSQNEVYNRYFSKHLFFQECGWLIPKVRTQKMLHLGASRPSWWELFNAKCQHSTFKQTIYPSRWHTDDIHESYWEIYPIPPFPFLGGACQTFKLNKSLPEWAVKFSEITIINVLLMLAARWFGEREVHLTKSGQPRWPQQVVGRNGRRFPMGFLVVSKDWRSSSHYLVYDRQSLKGFQKGMFFSLRDDTISVWSLLEIDVMQYLGD